MAYRLVTAVQVDVYQGYAPATADEPEQYSDHMHFAGMVSQPVEAGDDSTATMMAQSLVVNFDIADARELAPFHALPAQQANEAASVEVECAALYNGDKHIVTHFSGDGVVMTELLTFAVVEKSGDDPESDRTHELTLPELLALKPWLAALVENLRQGDWFVLDLHHDTDSTHIKLLDETTLVPSPVADVDVDQLLRRLSRY